MGPSQDVIPKSFTQDDPTCPSSHCSTSFTSAVAPQPVVAGSNTCATYAESGDTDTNPITMIGCSTETDPLGNATSYGWNVTDQVVKIVNAEHIVTQNVYGTNNNGDPTTGSDALANQTTTAFNSNLDATSATAPASASGQTAAVSDLAYNTTGATNPGYLPSSYVDPSGDCAYMSYDTAGNMTNTWTGQSSTSGTGTTRSCTKPASGGDDTVRTYEGDTGTPPGCNGKTGELCSTTTPNNIASGTATTYKYNSAGQLTTVTPPTPQQPTTYTYDPDGRVATVTDGAARTSTYTYDGDDRVTQVNYNAAGDPTCTNPATCVTYTHDPNGNETSQIDATGTTTFTYNARNQPLSEALPGATGTCGTATVAYTRDADGNLASYCDAGGTVTYTYNPLNQLTGLADPGGSCTPGSVVQPCTTYSYDPDGRQVQATWPTSTGSVQCTGYDSASNLLNIVAVNGTCTINTTTGAVTPTGTVLDSLTYKYTTTAGPTVDTAREHSVTDNVAGQTTTYGYNNNADLTSAANSAANTYAYSYDADGNMKTDTVNSGTPTSYTYNADDEQQVASAYPYTGAGDQTTTASGNRPHLQHPRPDQPHPNLRGAHQPPHLPRPRPSRPRHRRQHQPPKHHPRGHRHHHRRNHHQLLQNPHRQPQHHPRQRNHLLLPPRRPRHHHRTPQHQRNHHPRRHLHLRPLRQHHQHPHRRRHHQPLPLRQRLPDISASTTTAPATTTPPPGDGPNSTHRPRAGLPLC